MKNNMIRKCIVILMAVSCTSSAGIMVKFVKEEYEKHFEAVQIHCAEFFSDMCKEMKLDSGDTINKHTVGELLFYHALFTANDAVDCTRGGILETVYFWHWVKPNPRHRILRLPDSTPLAGLKPPKGYETYRSFADIDRLPSLYLADAFSESPAYFHPDCGPMHTFGWCSEREMAFGALLTALGFDCAIKQSGIHVWSEVLLELNSASKQKKRVILKLDNTFNTVGWEQLKTTVEKWRSTVGTGSMPIWYNRTSKSARELKAVKEIFVNDTTARRIEAAIERWYGK